MSPHLSSFASLSSRTPISVMFASAIPISVEGVRSVGTPYIYLIDVYYVPTLGLNLSSASQLCNSGCWVLFSD